MHYVDGSLQLSASDLVGHLNCRHLTSLDLAVARDTLARPFVWDPGLELLAERGARHEKAYTDHLRAMGNSVIAVDGAGVSALAVDQTLAAMKSGVDIIAQGALAAGVWAGRADILRRVQQPSVFGNWSYEIIDTKLARETKGGTVLQLCLYSSMLAATQKHMPEFAYVVSPSATLEAEPFRLADYAAYYRLVRASLENAVVSEVYDGGYPDPKDHCEICRWRLHCADRRRADDHPSFVAGITKSQIWELARNNVATTAALASTPTPLQWKPERGAAKSYEKVREQARIQVQGRTEGTTLYELLPVAPGFGLTCLPQPSEGDIFLDFEADPFVENGGLEFLFGYAFRDGSGDFNYVADWALSRAHEKEAFERFVDFVVARLALHPDLHIYHFAAYEPAALKRLMGRYGTRENEIDRMLRSKLFVDLHSVTRHGLRASVESYSIKKLEPLYEFTRTVPLSDVGKSLFKVQACLELGDVAGISAPDRDAVQGYNKDDCLSTAYLRDWLEARRAELIGQGAVVDRPPPEIGDPSEAVSAWQQKIADLMARLASDVPVDPTERTPEQRAKWLLANILDWHRREDKAAWWEHFRLRDLSADDLLEERAGLSGLSFMGNVDGGTTAAPIHRYTFPAQETELRGREKLRQLGGSEFGTVDDISLDERTVDIKKRKDTADVHPIAVYAHKIVPAKELAESLFRLGAAVADRGISGAGPYQAARDLLMLVGPRVGGEILRSQGETTLVAAMRIAPHLDNTVLPIQGPPGAGKTFTGAHMICALAKAGKKVGITANSHKVIRNLLNDVVKEARALSLPIQCIEKVRDKEDDVPGIKFSTASNAKVLQALGPDCQVAGGTAWLWSTEDAFDSVDVLFIDEAAQMSLANVLAVSQAAKSIVLLGDPRQLEQPIKGSHPEGTDVSALDHILGEHATVPADRGLFLEETWRLHPRICEFTSELFYEGRLRSREGLERQEIRSKSRVTGSGLRYLPVNHYGNQSASPEEAEAVRALVTEILASRTTWIDKDGIEAPIRLEDILIIAPYNAQVFDIQDRIPDAKVGTVDKFQGQQAPIVIYSVTTSSHADAPRGMEFLYSLNRLNVATSRAKCVCVLVASPHIFEPECRTPRQMTLANGFCRYREMADTI